MSTAEMTTSWSQLAGAKRRVVDLSLPHSPVVGYECDYEMEFDDDGFPMMPSPSWSAGSSSPCGVSLFSDDSNDGLPWSPALTPTFEDWDGPSSSTGPEVTVDCDGSQLILIPYESPFYHSPKDTHSFGFPFSAEPDLSPSSSPSSSSSSSLSLSTVQDPQIGCHDTTVSISRSDEDFESAGSANALRGPKLIVDTAFLSPVSTTGITFQALSASWYFSANTSDSAPWESDACVLDVPCSAISLTCPTELWDEDSGCLLLSGKDSTEADTYS